jgi:hypothetical protein
MMQFARGFAWKILLSLVIAFFLVAGIITPSYADVAPPPSPDGYTILPGDEKTQVRMMYENVFMNIDINGNAKVDANFVMRNLGEKEERMDVYFPLYNFEPHLKINDCTKYHLSNTPIADLAAWVWDQPQAIKTDDIQQPNYMAKPGESLTMNVPCWGIFPVVFPPGLDVPIEVKYTSPGYSYILTTGAGWNGTIGEADVTFRLPYEVIKGQNFMECYPETCTLNERDIQWVFKDFEPEKNLGIDAISPSKWWRILVETNALKLNPNDGAALGRLAIAYKDATRVAHNWRGYEDDPENWKRYQLSFENFEKALALLPDDANLHQEFAELVCLKALWNWGDDPNAQQSENNECAGQIKRALELQPKNKDAINWFNDILGYTLNETEKKEITAPQAEEIILTRLTSIQTRMQYHTPTPTSPPATITPAPTHTSAPTITPTAIQFISTATTIPPPLDTSTSAPISQDNTGAVWGWALIPLAAILTLIVLRRRGAK